MFKFFFTAKEDIKAKTTVTALGISVDESRKKYGESSL